MKIPSRSALLCLLLVAGPLTPAASAWDYEGHRIVNQLALASLPLDFPAFVRAPEASGRIAFLAGDPDRWKNTPEFALGHVNNPDHYLDIEQLDWAGLDAASLSPFRYEFAVRFAAGRAAHPEKFPADAGKNLDHTREWPGFLPWAITESFARLQSAFAYLKAFEQGGGTPEEIANARADVIYFMGVMGHYVGDGAQPLHVTVHHNGWVGDNPRGYTTDRKFHAWIDGGFIASAGVRLADLAPRVPAAAVLPAAPAPGGMFSEVMRYLQAQHARVEPLYQIEKEGKLRADGTPGSLDGRGFIEEQLLRGGSMLGSIWLTAWRTAPEDKYLLGQLALRHKPATAPAGK